MRTMLAAVFAIFAFASWGVEGKQPSTNFFIELVEKASGAEKEQFLSMLYGFGQGLITYDGWNRHKRMKRAFCPPDNLLIVHEQYFQMLKQQVRTKPSEGRKPFQMTLFNALQDTFPCK